MIISRTPFRLTLGGGGTDLPSYYRRHGGLIFAMGIDKHMYLMINPPAIDRKIRLHYTQSETVGHVDELKHELAREALRLHGIEDQMEISSMADLPAGTGLGSSSCYLVGLLNAIHQYKREFVSLQTLAEEACYIELTVLEKGIGKQDQYMAAYGGMTVLEIARDGTVSVSPIRLGAGVAMTLAANTHIYYTGVSRNAVAVLSDQHAAMKAPGTEDGERVAESLHRIKEIGYRVLEAIRSENFDRFGHLLDEHWQHKKRLSARITLSEVDRLYDEVKAEYGVLGGKIAGAGGGGFLMLYCPSNHSRLERFMASRGMRRLHYSIEMEGSKIIADFHNGSTVDAHARRTVFGKRAAGNASWFAAGCELGLSAATRVSADKE